MMRKPLIAKWQMCAALTTKCHIKDNKTEFCNQFQKEHKKQHTHKYKKKLTLLDKS